MGRLGYENKFRDKLEAREIRPGADSWKRLEQQLAAREETKRSRLWWPGMAAACVGLLLILGFMFQPKEDAVLVVEEQEAEQKENPSESRKENPAFFKMENKHSAPIVTEVPSLEEEKQSQNYHSRNDGIVSQEGLEAEVPEAHWIKQDETEVVLEEQMKELGLADLLLEEEIDDAILWQKLDEVLAEAGKLQGDSGVVSDTEIDALLLLAAEDISNNRPGLGMEVSAENLLYEVEMELEESFRERVFELLKQGLEKTRTAVVNRMQ